MLNDGSERDRNDGKDSGYKKTGIHVAACEDVEYGVLILNGQADPGCIRDVLDAGN